MQISEHIERLVTLLKGDEPSHNLDEVDEDDTRVVARMAAPEPGSDDEDNKIEEV